MSLRVLVVDDSALYRKIVTEALNGINGVEVVGSAYSGKSALQKIPHLKPDVLTVDLEMPDMDGIELVHAMREQKISAKAIMVSAFTERGGAQTIKALEAGAIDFVTKQGSGTSEEQLLTIRAALSKILLSLSHHQPVRHSLTAPPFTPQRAVQAPTPGQKFEMVLVGISTGGPVALGKLIPALGPSIGVPMVIVQHMPPLFTRHLAESLDKQSGLNVKEAEAGESLQPDWVYIAPGGKHLRLEKNAVRKPVVRLTDEPPENNCRPSVDVLFRSAAHHFPGKSAAIIMTGMGNDGTRGLQLLKRHNTPVIAQDEQSCVVYGMPREAVKAGVVDQELPLSEIAQALHSCLRGSALG